MTSRPLIALAGLAACLAACQHAPTPVAEAPAAALPAHLGPPPAAVCTVAPFQVADGGTTNVLMTLSNEGGYCAASLVAGNGRPFDAPLVHVRPLHGHVVVVRYNGRTSVEYRPDPGFIGTDRFTVRLIVRGRPGYTVLNVTATAHRV